MRGKLTVDQTIDKINIIALLIIVITMIILALFGLVTIVPMMLNG